MNAARKPRIVVAGAGIAGSLIVNGLAERDDIELICLERSTAAAQMDAGTGLNVGPNAIKALRQSMPATAQLLVDNALPWQRWNIGLTDGTELVDIDLGELADSPGIRIRWAELYVLLREPIAKTIRWNTELVEAGRDSKGVFVTTQSPAGKERIEGIDLLIAGDGRYSAVRDTVFGSDPPNFLGVCLYRVLFPVDADCPIDDYGQWFNGPNRLLAFLVPGGYVYCAGSFPIDVDAPTPDSMKTAEALRTAYTPSSGQLSAQAGFLVDKICEHVDAVHWARLQDGPVRFGGEPGVLLVGDASHPMVPTLGQGATQSVEDACVVVDQIVACLDQDGDLSRVPERVEAVRRERVQFVVDFSRAATDTMLAGADPVTGSRKKNSPEFRAKLERLYRDVAGPAR